MKAQWMFIIPLLQLVLANVHVDFNLHENDEYSLISSGRSSSDVDATVRFLFSITEERLRDGVEALAGSRPDQVFFSEPMGNLGTPFLHMGWRETRAETILLSYDDPEIKRDRVRIYSEHYSTDDGVRNTININLTMRHEHEVFHSWGHFAQSGMDIDYRWVLDNRRSFVYSNNWGNWHSEVMSSETRTATDPIELTPNSNLTMEVFRRIVTVATGFVYSTHLSGHVVGFWSRGFNGRQFWAYDVQPVLRFGGMPLQAFTSERVSVLYNLGHEVRFRHTEEDDLRNPQ